MEILDYIRSILDKAWFFITSAESTIYWGYLTSTLIIAVMLYFYRTVQSERFKLRGLWAFCFPKRVYRNFSFVQDITMFLVNHSSLFVLFSFFILTNATVAVWVWKGLYYTFGAPTVLLDGWQAQVLLMFLSLIAIDLGFFISHYLQHKISFLWEFHKIHHTANQLNPLTAFRRHPLDLVVDGNISGLITGIVFGLSDYFSNGTLESTMILGVNAVIFIFMMLVGHFQHTHIWISFGSRLNKIFISPAMHQIHHSSAPEHMDKNMGSIFSIWDGLMGTRHMPGPTPQDLKFGIAEQNVDKQLTGIFPLYLEPFSAAYVRLRSLFVARQQQHTKKS